MLNAAHVTQAQRKGGVGSVTTPSVLGGLRAARDLPLGNFLHSNEKLWHLLKRHATLTSTTTARSGSKGAKGGGYAVLAWICLRIFYLYR